MVAGMKYITFYYNIFVDTRWIKASVKGCGKRSGWTDFSQYPLLMETDVFKVWGSTDIVFGRFLSSQGPLSWWIHYGLCDVSQVVLSFLMLSGTNSCRIDRHSLHASALCKSSCNCNELQSGLFGMLLIFDANIWDEQTLWTTEKWQIKFLPLPMRSYPHQLSTAKPVCFLLFKMLYPSGSVSTIPCPFVLFSYFFGYSFCLSLSLCSTESNSDWPSPTGLCWRPTLRRWSVSPIFSSLSLPPSVPFPLPSPFLFVTSVDTLTGRDSQTSQFPHGLGYFALGLRKYFLVDSIIYLPHKKKGPRIWICHSLPHEMTYTSHNCCFLLDISSY